MALKGGRIGKRRGGASAAIMRLKARMSAPTKRDALRNRNGFWETTYSTRTGETTLTVVGPKYRIAGINHARSLATMKLDRESAIRLAARLLRFATEGI